ncbi:hypothetical protein Tco_1385396 [Tanacetum coccineum]
MILIEEMDKDWQIAMTAIHNKKFYKNTGMKAKVDGKIMWQLNKRKVEMFQLPQRWHVARSASLQVQRKVQAGTVSSAGTHIKSGSSRFNTGKQNVNSGSVHVNTARVNRPVSNQTSYKTSPKLSQVNLNSPKKCFSKQSSPVNRPFSRNTAYKSNKYAVKGKMGTAVKTSAGCVWRKVIPLSNTNSGPTPDSNVNDHPLKHMEHRGIFDSGCSGHMTGNRAHLEDYQELSKVGSVTFGGSKGLILLSIKSGSYLRYYLELERMLQAQLGHEKGHASCHLLIGCRLVVSNDVVVNLVVSNDVVVNLL